MLTEDRTLSLSDDTPLIVEGLSLDSPESLLHQGSNDWNIWYLAY